MVILIGVVKSHIKATKLSHYSTTEYPSCIMNRQYKTCIIDHIKYQIVFILDFLYNVAYLLNNTDIISGFVRLNNITFTKYLNTFIEF